MTVFANSLEISSKAQGCKVIAAFPDTCFTPPQTPATPPGVPIPYPDFGKDPDVASGSGTVKIGGKEISQENSSKYSKCTGDEAGAAPKKGIITSKNTGAVYAQKWSMDVKVEGKGVVRFSDMATSNHSSNPGDSPPMVIVGGVNPAAPTPEERQCMCECDELHPEEIVQAETDPDEKTTQDRIDKLLASPSADTQFEGRAAAHNFQDHLDDDNAKNISRGHVLEPTALALRCSNCGCMTREIDHVTPDGTPVEVKSGKKTGVNSKQGDRNAALLAQMRSENPNAQFTYKLNSATKRTKASVDAIRARRFNVVMI